MLKKDQTPQSVESLHPDTIEKALKGLHHIPELMRWTDPEGQVQVEYSFQKSLSDWRIEYDGFGGWLSQCSPSELLDLLEEVNNLITRNRQPENLNLNKRLIKNFPAQDPEQLLGKAVQDLDKMIKNTKSFLQECSYKDSTGEPLIKQVLIEIDFGTFGLALIRDLLFGCCVISYSESESERGSALRNARATTNKFQILISLAQVDEEIIEPTDPYEEDQNP